MADTLKTREKKSLTKMVSGYTFVLIFFAIFIAYLVANGGATTWNGVMNILRHSAVVGIMAYGMGLVILTGDIDLSVGAILPLVGGLTVMVFNSTNNMFVTLLFALFMGAVCGLFNGVLVGLAKMPAFIVTLSTMLIYRSLAQYTLRIQGLSIYNMNGTLSSYQNFYGFGQAKVATVPAVGLVFVAITIIMVFISTSTKFGKSVYAVGSNERAARLAGVNVKFIRVLVFTITGLLCGLAAFLWLAMNGSVDPATVGKSNEMYAIAAVVIGGIAMSGGKGKLIGVMFGAMSYTIIDKIIASIGFDALINDTIKGSILLIAVLIQIVIPMLRSRMKPSDQAPASGIPCESGRVQDESAKQ